MRVARPYHRRGTDLAYQTSYLLYMQTIVINFYDVFRVRSKEYKKRSLQNVPLVLAPGIDIGISV